MTKYEILLLLLLISTLVSILFIVFNCIKKKVVQGLVIGGLMLITPVFGPSMVFFSFCGGRLLELFKTATLNPKELSFDKTKIKVILLDGLEPWQELNVTAFLMSGIAQSGEITGEPYEDADGVRYLPMSQQPIVILTADSEKLKEVMQKATARGMEVAIYTKELFTTFNDEDNRAAVKRFKTDELDLAGIAIRGLRNQLDRITKGLEMHR